MLQHRQHLPGRRQQQSLPHCAGCPPLLGTLARSPSAALHTSDTFAVNPSGGALLLALAQQAHTDDGGAAALSSTAEHPARPEQRAAPSGAQQKELAGSSGAGSAPALVSLHARYGTVALVSAPHAQNMQLLPARAAAAVSGPASLACTSCGARASAPGRALADGATSARSTSRAPHAVRARSSVPSVLSASRTTASGTWRRAPAQGAWAIVLIGYMVGSG